MASTSASTRTPSDGESSYQAKGFALLDANPKASHIELLCSLERHSEALLIVDPELRTALLLHAFLLFHCALGASNG